MADKQLPKKGEVWDIGGLLFQVKFVDHKRGKLQLELYTPEKVVPRPFQNAGGTVEHIDIPVKIESNDPAATR